MTQCAQEVVAEALEQLELDGAELAQTLGQGAFGGMVEEQSGVAEDISGLVIGDDGLVPELVQGLAFLSQTRVVLGVGGQLEHPLVPPILDDEGDRAGAAPEPFGHPDAALEGVAGTRRGRVGTALAVGTADPSSTRSR